VGAVALAGESGPGVEACQGQRRRAWCGRHDYGGASSVAAGALGGGPPGAERGHVPAVAGPPGGDPQAEGGERLLGVPTCLDRLICQAIAQVLTPVFDPEFSVVRVPSRPVRPSGGAGQSEGQARSARGEPPQLERKPQARPGEP
jgi:hypothetical protein